MADFRPILSFLWAATFALAASAAPDPAPASAVPDPAAPRETVGGERPDTRTQVLDTASLTGMERLIEIVSDRRAIFVGESHDRYEDHLNQLAILEGLHRLGKPLAIGTEFFQQPFQPALDAYVAGEIDEAELLRRTEYFDRWRFDYRLYRPILRFAREHAIPLVALNLPAELTSKVGEVGIAGLSPEERAQLPAEIDHGDPIYRERIKAVFAMHPTGKEGDFERFIEVQLLWDEGMAERAARYLAEHPERTLVVLAGSGHLEYDQGIPRRVLRRAAVPAATILNGNNRDVEPTAADFLLFPRQVPLPAAGLLGVMLSPGIDAGGANVEGFAEDSGAKAAGLEKGDRIVEIGGRPVESYADVRLALIDSRPGERIPVKVLRKRMLGADERLDFDVELH